MPGGKPTKCWSPLTRKRPTPDLASLPAGGVCVYPDDLKFAARRDDVVYYPLPVKELVKNSGADAKLRDYIANMAYVGALAELLQIKFDEIKSALSYHFKGKAKAVDLNYSMVQAAASTCARTCPSRIPIACSAWTPMAARC